MPRKTTIVASLALLVAALMPAGIAPASAAGSAQPGDQGRYVNLNTVNETTAPKSFKDVKPDVRTDLGGGKTMEVYTSIGDSEGAMDWRTINLFSYLVNSVPKAKNSYTTLFNSLYDLRSVGYDDTKDRWTLENPSEAFAPTAAYLNQANKYSNPADPQAAQDEREKYIHVLGAKESIDEAYAANSSLARLVRAGYKSSRPKAVDYQECRGAGACVTYTGSDNLMHSKYGAFEQAADSTGAIRDNVVFITSSNLNGSSGSKKTNTSIVIYGDKTTYDAVKYDIYGTQVEIAKGMSVSDAVNATRVEKRSLFENGQPLPTGDPSATYKDAMAVGSSGVAAGIPTGSGLTLYPSPRGNSTATVAGMDAEAKFLLDQAATGQKNSSCKVYAIHSLFNGTRSGVQDALGQLSSQKCDVRIVLGNNAISDIIDGYFTMSTDLRQVIDRVQFANVHDKAFTYKYGSTATTFGGSTNFTGTSLEYDELAFRADNAAVTQATQNHFEYVYELAKGSVKWTKPTSVAVSPSSSTSKQLQVKANDTVQLSTRVAPTNALVTNTEWSSTNPAVATVSADGKVQGKIPGTAVIDVRVTSPNNVVETSKAYVNVTAAGTTSAGSFESVTTPPVLTMERYQAPGGNTPIQVTWGSGDKDYSGVVKLQYYSGGWKTYPTMVEVKNGVGRISPSFGSSKTWRAYGARLDGIYREGQLVGNGSTAKTMSGWSISTVRTKTSSLTPRLYATNLAKVSQTVPFLISWARSSGVVRLQMRASGGSWKTHSTYRIPSGSSQDLIGIPIANTKYWRLATSTGSTKISNTVKVSMK